MEHTDWDHTFPSTISTPPDKTSLLHITVECFHDGLQLHTSRNVEQHIYNDHQIPQCKYI